MLREQIEALQLRENDLNIDITQFEERAKKARIELTLIKQAKKSLEKLEERLDGQTTVSE